jgi:hypothetical protein
MNLNALLRRGERDRGPQTEKRRGREIGRRSGARGKARKGKQESAEGERRLKRRGDQNERVRRALQSGIKKELLRHATNKRITEKTKTKQEKGWGRAVRVRGHNRAP